MGGSKRTPRSFRYRNLRISPEAIEAFRRGDARALHELLELRPWELSPIDVHLRPEPSRATKSVFLQSWGTAMRLRHQLLAACGGMPVADPEAVSGLSI
jgi:hypothetical protein